MNNNNMNFQQNFPIPFQFNLNNNNNIFNPPPSIFNNMNNMNDINNFNNMNGLMNPNMIANNNYMNFCNNMNMNNCNNNYNNQSQINDNLFNNQETTEYHINFKLDHDISYLIIEKDETEIKELLEKYISKIIRKNFSFPSIYEIQFLYKEKIIKFNYMFLTIKEYFKDDHNPTIIVNDVNNIFKVYSATFVINSVFNRNYLVNHDIKFFYLIIEFIKNMHEEFPGIKEIEIKKYLYNGIIYDMKNQTSFLTCGEIFKNQYNPIIYILEQDYLNDTQPIIVDFESTNGFKHQITINKYKTINALLIKFYEETDTEIGCDITFIHNCSKLEHSDSTPVGKFFKFDFKPSIIIVDVRNLIGQINITFEINCEEKYELIIKKMNELLEAFLEEYLIMNLFIIRLKMI